MKFGLWQYRMPINRHIWSQELLLCPKIRQIRKRMKVEQHLINLELMIVVFIVLTLSTLLQFHEAKGRNAITRLKAHTEYQ